MNVTAYSVHVHYYEGYCTALRDIYRLICVSDGVWERATRAKRKLLAMMDHILSDPDRFARTGGEAHFVFRDEGKNKLTAIWEVGT